MLTEMRINTTIITTHKKDFLTYLLCLYTCDQTVTDNKWCCGRIVSKADINFIQRITGLTRETIRNHIKHFAETESWEGPTAIIPIEQLTNLFNAINEMRPADRNATVRMWCYLVMQCWSYQQFSRSEKLIAQDLNIKLNDVAPRINWLVRQKFIAIRKNHYHFSTVSKPRIYALYTNQVPVRYAHDKWFIGNLMDRSAASLDQILDEYKNSF